MRVVPLNRVLIQPTVQCKWIEQHKTIEFVIPKQAVQLFENAWQQYSLSACADIASFASSPSGRSFELHDHDLLFALLAGADFISRQYASFEIDFNQENLSWSI